MLLGAVVNVLAAVQHARDIGGMAAGTAPHRPRRSLGIGVAVVLAALGVAMALYLVTTRG